MGLVISEFMKVLLQDTEPVIDSLESQEDGLGSSLVLSSNTQLKLNSPLVS